MSRHLSLVLSAAVLCACGPGRQAAWEQQGTAGQTPPPQEGQAPEDTDEKAQALAHWEKRAERAELEQAIALLAQAVEKNPNDAESWTLLSRACHLLGDTHQRFANENDAMLATFERGVQAGERAMMASSPAFAKRVQDGEKVEDAVKDIPKEGQAAIYWYATNIGKFAVAKGFTTTLFYKDRIFAVMTHVLGMDEAFFFAAPHRYFGAFYAKAPSFAGGDMDKAKKHFDRSLELEPRYFGTKVLLAEYWATKAGDKDLYERELKEVLAGDVNVIPEIAPEQLLEQKKAKILLDQIGDKF